MKKLIFKILAICIAGILTYFAGDKFSDSISVTPVRIIGGIMIALSLIYIFYETKNHLPFFYGKSQSGGSNANGSVVAGIGLGIFATNIAELAAIMVALIIYTVILSKKYDME